MIRKSLYTFEEYSVMENNVPHKRMPIDFGRN
jgi:hypothetical protein